MQTHKLSSAALFVADLCSKQMDLSLPQNEIVDAGYPIVFCLTDLCLCKFALLLATTIKTKFLDEESSRKREHAGSGSTQNVFDLALYVTFAVPWYLAIALLNLS